MKIYTLGSSKPPKRQYQDKNPYAAFFLEAAGALPSALLPRGTLLALDAIDTPLVDWQCSGVDAREQNLARSWSPGRGRTYYTRTYFVPADNTGCIIHNTPRFPTLEVRLKLGLFGAKLLKCS